MINVNSFPLLIISTTKTGSFSRSAFRSRSHKDQGPLTFSRVAPAGCGTAGGARRGEKKSTSRKKSRSLARRGLSAFLGGVSACVCSCVRACVRVRGLSRVRRENSFSGPHETIKSRRRGGRCSTGSFFSSPFLSSPSSLSFTRPSLPFFVSCSPAGLFLFSTLLPRSLPLLCETAHESQWLCVIIN